MHITQHRSPKEARQDFTPVQTVGLHSAYRRSPQRILQNGDDKSAIATVISHALHPTSREREEGRGVIRAIDRFLLFSLARYHNSQEAKY